MVTGDEARLREAGDGMVLGWSEEAASLHREVAGRGVGE